MSGRVLRWSVGLDLAQVAYYRRVRDCLPWFDEAAVRIKLAELREAASQVDRELRVFMGLAQLVDIGLGRMPTFLKWEYCMVGDHSGGTRELSSKRNGPVLGRIVADPEVGQVRASGPPRSLAFSKRQTLPLPSLDPSEFQTQPLPVLYLKSEGQPHAALSTAVSG